ncbi:MAG TPA: Na(+)-translocating NADH-quinone reductase subunit A, partial [Pirellulaceae bacterium]|nr:Na(+)-translocating NADH-quinone reductase subunit A [Pirellulaceae bacterium]
FLSIIIDVEDGPSESFPAFENLRNLTTESARDLLLQSGLWTCLRTRPFNLTPSPDTEPHSVFVTAMDTNPLAAEAELIIAERREEFVSGLMVVSKLTRGKTFVCTRDDSRVPGHEVPGVEFHAFDGPHPAGLPGTHIHFLDPVGPNKTVWFLNYQDVIAIGHLFRTGKLQTQRVISVAGPLVKKPSLYRVPMGANLDQIVADNADLRNARIISGSPLYGRTSEPPVNFLGRFNLQVSVLEEGTQRHFIGWMGPGFDKFSVTKIYAGSWMTNKLFALNTNVNGGKRAMVPVGTYERVMPLDLLPTHLLRSLICKDTESAQALGCLELDEEDLALCTYVCPGKYDYGQLLRENLRSILKDG